MEYLGRIGVQITEELSDMFAIENYPYGLTLTGQIEGVSQDSSYVNVRLAATLPVIRIRNTNTSLPVYPMIGDQVTVAIGDTVTVGNVCSINYLRGVVCIVDNITCDDIIVNDLNTILSNQENSPFPKFTEGQKVLVSREEGYLTDVRLNSTCFATGTERKLVVFNQISPKIFVTADMEPVDIIEPEEIPTTTVKVGAEVLGILPSTAISNVGLEFLGLEMIVMSRHDKGTMIKCRDEEGTIHMIPITHLKEVPCNQVI